jgi:hypothetical protein
MTESSDHSLLVTIAQGLARVEAGINSLNGRIDRLDRTIDDHEDRLRVVERSELVTTDDLGERDARAAQSRRWLVTLICTNVVVLLAAILSYVSTH